MAFTSRRLLPQTLTDSYSPSPSLSPSPLPSPAPSPSIGIACLNPCDPSCPFSSNCPWLYTSPPPPPPSTYLPSPPTGRSPLLSTPVILSVSLVSSLFLLTVYFILLARYRRNRRPNSRAPHQGPPPPPGDDGRWGDGEEWNQNLAMVHPIWLINTVGLQPAVIGAISVCEFRKGEGLIDGDYCSICLSEFEEGESLRLLPKCSHAFHMPCIDTWFRSHTNCPLCRAPILAPAPASGSLAVLEPTGSGSRSGVGEGSGENAEGGDATRDDNGDSVGGDEGGNGEDKSSMEEVEIGASVGRRSVSMDGIANGIVNLGSAGNERGRIRMGGVRSLPGSGRFCRSGSRHS